MVDEKKLTLGERFRKWYKNLPESKKYVEFFSAILAVPVLLTVLILNYNNIKGSNNKNSPTPIPQVKNGVTIIPVTIDKDAPPSPTSTPACKKGVGPIEITSPTEDQNVTQSPVCFNIEYKDESYCSAVWSYRIDNGQWSEYTDKSICLYNLSNGSHKFELRVKSVSSDDQTQLVRNFNYQGGSNPTVTLTPTPTP